MKKQFQFQVPIGTKHPKPCPDCGAGMILDVMPDGKFRYRCERGQSKCYGSASADKTGRPLGTPIDREGRRRRYELHRLIDCWWRDPITAKTWQGLAKRRFVYAIMSLYMNVEEFHIGDLNHAQLAEAFKIASEILPPICEAADLKKGENYAPEVQYN